MNSFLIQCKVRKAELLQFLGITAVGYLIGLIVVFIVMNVAKENTCATAGTMLAVIAFAFIHLFGITLSFMGDFTMAISWVRPEKALSQAMYFLICWRSQCWNLRSLCLV